MAAIVLYDRVKESSTTTGTGNFTLAGAATGGYQTFNNTVGVGPFCYYAIVLSANSEWEVGRGHLSDSTTLVRDEVYIGSNGTSLVNFSAGTKDVFIPLPAAFALPYTTTGDILYLASNGKPTRLAIQSDGSILTVTSGIPAWSSVGTAPFVDTQTIVKGSVDATKLIRFEVDGLTTATTRVITVPNFDINLPGTNILNTWTLGQTFSASPMAPFGSGARTERFGSGAGRDAATGADNITVGNNAGDALTSGANNVLIGSNAGGALTSSSFNIAIGHNTLDAATSSSTSNVCIGDSSGGAITSGDNNTLIGDLAGTVINSGIGNVVIGATSGITTGSTNIVIGVLSGGVLTTGSDNILIGNNAETGTSSTANAIALGQNAIATTGVFAVGPFITTQTWFGNSSTSVRERASLFLEFVVSTDATRTTRFSWYAWDFNSSRECFRGEGTGTAAAISFFGVNAVVRQTSGADLTNNVTSGGTDDTIANFTDLTIYANDAATIRNDIYQLSRKLKKVNDALRLYGLLT